MADLKDRTEHEEDLKRKLAAVMLLYRDDLNARLYSARIQRETQDKLKTALAGVFLLSLAGTGRELGLAIDGRGAAAAWANTYGTWLGQRVAANVYRDVSMPMLTPDEMNQLMGDLTDPAHWDALAATEVTRAAVAGGEFGAMAGFGVTGRQAIATWHTEGDQKVCFPAGTMVRTERGDVPIESIAVGELVKTRLGMRRVMATIRRPYSGRMVRVVAGNRSVVSTEDHPYWTLEKGWLPGCELRSGHTIHTVDDQLCKIDSVHNFALSNADNVQSSTVEGRSLAGVSVGVSVPVSAVHFQGNRLVGQQEINRVATLASLLEKHNSESSQRQADSLFNRCFRSAFAIAGEATKPAISIARLAAESLLARLAVCEQWRPAALLRAETTSALAFASERLAASLARYIYGVGGLALVATNGIAIGDRRFDREGLSAHGTTFRSSLQNRNSARSRAMQLIPRGESSGRQIELLPTNFARSVFSETLSLSGKQSQFGVSSRHSIDVFDLQVQGVPEFFANGILAHNCPLCAPFDLTEREVWSQFYPLGPPSPHPNCRCWLEYEFGEG